MVRPISNENRNTFCWTLRLTLALTLASLPVQPLVAQESLKIEFNLLTLPSCRQTLIALNSPALATFEKRPLGECFRTLGDAYRVPIWVDRRVDLSRLVTVVGVQANEPPEARTTLGRLTAVAKLGGADAGLVENVVYVGPADQIGSIQRAAVRLHNEIMTSRKGASKTAQVESRSLSWKDITTPAELLEDIQKQWSIEVSSDLPHDLMHAGELPSSTLATQLTLLHAGFGRQVECSSGVFTTSPLVQESVWQAEYADNELQNERLAAARKEFPSATLQVKGKVSTVTGPTGFHLRLLALRVPASRVPNSRNVEPKYKIPEIRAPLERVIGELARKLGMEVKWSNDIPEIKRLTVITFGVSKDKTVDEILKQIADENGLNIQRQQQTIEVSP